MSVEPLVIIGSGGFARETAACIQAINAHEPRWKLEGFLDDNVGLHGTEVGGVPVLGETAMASQLEHAALVVCVGNPANYFSRRRIVERLAVEEERYATLIHPSAALAERTRVGRGTVVLAQVVSTDNAIIGDHVAVMPQVTFTHDVRVAEYVTVASAVALAGGVSIGQGAYLGAGAMVGADVGQWSQIGMGSVVRHPVDGAEVWVGNPARRLRTVDVPPDVD